MKLFIKVILDNLYGRHFPGNRILSRVLGFQETYRFPGTGSPEHVEFRVGAAIIVVGDGVNLRTACASFARRTC